MGKVLVISAYPLVHPRKDVLQVPDTVVTRLDRIIAQVLRPGAWIIGSVSRGCGHLLRSVTVKRITGLGLDDLTGDLSLLPDVLGSDHRSVQPLDGIFIINPQRRRHKLDAFVPRLRHIVEAGIVHDRRGRTILRSESGVPQRVGRVGRGGSHVVHESESVTYLVGNHIDKRLVDDVLRHLHRTDLLVHLRRLHEAPVVDELDDIVVHKHRSVQYLTGHRINPRRSHGVHRGVRDIPDA